MYHHLSEQLRRKVPFAQAPLLRWVPKTSQAKHAPQAPGKKRSKQNQALHVSQWMCQFLLVLFKNWTLVLDSVKRVHCSLVPFIPWFPDSYVRKRLLNRKGWSFHLECLSSILPYSTEHLSTFQNSELLSHIKSTGKGVNSQRLFQAFFITFRDIWCEIEEPMDPVPRCTCCREYLGFGWI